MLRLQVVCNRLNIVGKNYNDRNQKKLDHVDSKIVWYDSTEASCPKVTVGYLLDGVPMQEKQAISYWKHNYFGMVNPTLSALNRLPEIHCVDPLALY